MTCKKFSGKTEQKQEAGIMKNVMLSCVMPSLLFDEKTCFIRLPPNTLQKFWQIVTVPQTRTQIQKKA